MSVDIAVLASFIIESAATLPRIPVLGESVKADYYYMAPGGKGTNQAAAMARQQKNVGIAAKVGDDIFGKMALDLFEKEGIGIKGVSIASEEKTGIGLVYINPDGDNCIGIYMGANEKLTGDDVKNIFSDYMPAKVVTAQLESPDEAILEAFVLGKSNSAITLLNTAPARTVDEEILSYTDIITPNESEARLLAGFRPDDTRSLSIVASRLIEIGPKIVVITLGSKGCIVFEKNSKMIKIEPYKVDAIDALGAGDCFSGSLAVALSEGKNIVEAAKWASVAAALSTLGHGGIAPLPFRDQVEEHFEIYKKIYGE